MKCGRLIRKDGPGPHVDSVLLLAAASDRRMAETLSLNALPFTFTDLVRVYKLLHIHVHELLHIGTHELCLICDQTLSHSYSQTVILSMFTDLRSCTQTLCS